MNLYFFIKNLISLFLNIDVHDCADVSYPSQSFWEGGHAWASLHTGLRPALSQGPLSRFSQASSCLTPRRWQTMSETRRRLLRVRRSSF